ncbi:hypothetical protein GGR52DRAFT_573842 [Hypoxylon sp. FL1284]|nr:hypothetical protein GGR52DRAFT_573842 [Hypoxylon sp. FL1284]
MKVLKLSLALASHFTLISSTAACQQSSGPLEPLTPWQVTRLSTHSPSGRPGNSPLAYILANITNPGSGASSGASSANCSVYWAYADEKPYGAVHDCSIPYPPSRNVSGTSCSSQWTIEILEMDTGLYPPTEKMDVRFTLTSNLTVDGDTCSTVYVGTQHFEVGENMRGSCGGSGVALPPREARDTEINIPGGLAVATMIQDQP